MKTRHILLISLLVMMLVLILVFILNHSTGTNRAAEGSQIQFEKQEASDTSSVAGSARVDPSAPEQPATSAGWDGALRALAEVKGAGMIHCDLKDLRSQDAMRVSGAVSRPRFEGGVLVGMVNEPSGSTTLHIDFGLPDAEPPPDTEHLSYKEGLDRYWEWKHDQDRKREEIEYRRRVPVALLKWWDSWPGEVGQCIVTAPRPASISGVVVGEDGASRAGANVLGCIDRVTSDSEGLFELEAVVDSTCNIVVSAGPDLRGQAAIVPLDSEGVDGVIVEVRAAETRSIPPMSEVAAGFVRAAEDLVHAMQTPGLDAETLRILEEWQNEVELDASEFRHKQEQWREMSRALDLEE